MPRIRPTGRGTRRAGASGPQKLEPDNNEVSLSEIAPAPASTAPEDSSAATEAPETTTNIQRSVSARRGATSSRATGGSGALRLRPKNVRRDEAERDSLARQEEKRAVDRAAEERRAQGRSSRQRSSRSRGNAMGSRGGFGQSVSTASGPFSAGFAGSAGSSRGGMRITRGGSGSKGSGTFSRAGKSGSAGASGIRQTNSSYPRESRINADKLHAMTPDEELDSEDEATVAALNARTSNVLPMGIYRREHKETGVVVATTAELEAAENATGEEESLWIDGRGPNSSPQPDQPEEQGIWDLASKATAKIKKEDGAENGMDVDAQESKEAKAAAVSKAKKVLPADQEDKMIQSDMALLANELGVTAIAEDGEDAAKEPANKDGRMYLFQFPPLLPPLRQTSARPAANKVKAEPQDVHMAEALPSTSDPAHVDLTAEDEAAGPRTATGEEEDPEDSRGFMSELLAQGGMLGKLNVRKSGKTELDWGGRVLELSPAAGMNFLTTAVIVEESDDKAPAGQAGGDSIAMGTIMGRFVVAPTWSEEEEWVVPPEEVQVG